MRPPPILRMRLASNIFSAMLVCRASAAALAPPSTLRSSAAAAAALLSPASDRCRARRPPPRRHRPAAAEPRVPDPARAVGPAVGGRSTAPPRCSRLLSSAAGGADGGDGARVVFLGTPDVAAASLRSIVEESEKGGSPYEVVGVVTQPPKRRKRRGKAIPSPVGMVAEELDIPVLCPEKAKDADFLDELENEVRPDLCITAAYGQYLPKRFLATPTYGTVNIHPSLLPRWRGASPVQRSLEAGDNPVGVTVLFTVSKMDAGPIISQKSCKIHDDEQATTLLPYLFDVGTELLLEAMPDVISGKITMETAQQQDEDRVVNADMISASEGELKVWKECARVCHNKCRGFSIWPGTHMFFRIGDDEGSEPVRVKVIKTRVLEERSDPTDAVDMGPQKGDGLRVVCGDGSILEVLEVQPATRKVMDAKSFVNGLRGKTLRWVEMPEEEPERS